MILPVRLSAVSRPDYSSLVALVDPQVPFLCIPPALAAELGLHQIDTRMMRDAGGNPCVCPYMGPVMVEARGAKAHMGAVVCGSEVVLGQAALSALGLFADERHGKVYTHATPAVLHSLHAR